MSKLDLDTDTKKVVRKYALAVAWYLIHEDDESMKEKIVQVTEKIGELEQDLLDRGISRENIDKILQRAKKFVKKTVGEMSDKELETMCKLIFGQKTEMRPFDRRELNKPGVIYFDPIKYAERIRKQKENKS